MGRPEADNDHQDAQPSEAFHQTPEDHQSQQHPISYPSPSTHNSMTYIVGRPIRRADSNDDDREPAEHNETPNPSSDSNRMHEHQENQTHQEVQPRHNHHHHVHYHLPTTNTHSTNLMTLHNCPNNNAHQHQSQAMPPGLRPHPLPFYPPTSHPLHHSHYSGSQHVRHHSQPYSNYSGPQHVRQNSQLSNYSGTHHVRHHSQPFSNYSGSQHVQQVVLHPPPAAYNYPSYNNNFATGIPTNIEYMPVLMPQSGGDGTTWKTGLFDCLLDPSTAVLTMFCPCWTFGQIAEIVDNGQTACSGNAVIYMVICCFIVVPCLLSCTYRRKMRNKFDLPESPGPDCFIHFLCEYCALCQEHRELQLRGLDPSLGWVGNMEQMHRLQQKQRQATMVPPVTQRMGY